MKYKLIEGLKGKLSYHKTGIKMLKYLQVIDSSAIPVSIIKSILDAAFPYIGIIISAEIIDALIGKQYKNALILAAILIISDFIVGTIISFLQEVLMHKEFMINKKFNVLLRKKSLDLDYETMTRADVIDKISYTERMVKYHGGLEKIVDEYVNYLSSAISIITSSVLVVMLCISKPSSGYTFFNFIASTPVSIIIIALLIIGMLKPESVISSFFEKKQKKLMEKDTEGESQLSYLMNQVFYKYEMGKVARIFQMEDMILDKYTKWSNKNRAVYSQECDNDNEEKSLNVTTNAIFSVISYAIVIVKILTKSITIGFFTKYTGALIQLNNNITKMIKSGSEIKRRCSYLEEFISFMELKNGMETGSASIEKSDNSIYEIEFHDVSFHYPNNEELVLDHVNCKLAIKHKMALVGRNGAGKSTFIKLLCRLYDPTGGAITLNGIDIRKYDYKQYQGIFAVVFQDFNLFSFPVGENVAASKEMEEDRVWNCLENAGAYDRVRKMPEQLKTPLYKYEDNGVEISGGEAQKIAIARALYKDAPIIILDEPTAALDPISEQEIYLRFGEMTNNKTSIVISHRMSSCRFCDDIIVFDKGKIVERGSHDELLANNEYYAKLWNAQCQYYA